MRLTFSGEVRKPVVREHEGKSILSFQMMKKNYNKDKSADVAYTWLNITVFDVKPFQLQQFTERAFVTGGGEFTMRSYVDKDGAKRQSVDVRCSSMDVDAAYVEREQGQEAPSKTTHHNVVSHSTATANDEPPF